MRAQGRGTSADLGVKAAFWRSWPGGEETLWRTCGRPSMAGAWSGPGASRDLVYAFS